MAEFETPIFLQNHSPKEVFDLMKTILPDDLDLSEGGHAFNLLMPTALVVAEVCEFVLPEVVKLIFPEFSYGEFLDEHAKSRGLSRRAANAASGKLTITGIEGSVIPAGSMFSTAAINDQPAVIYKTVDTVKIPESGSVSVDIVCTQTGTEGNTGENTIVLVAGRLTGVTGVTNEEPVTGGTVEESDESIIERIAEYDKSQGESYVGSASDYKRWAMSVAGVGSATIITAKDTSGLVTIIITDANGDPATEQLCTSVYNYIMRPDDPYERLAPINAILKVEPPATMQISIKATVELTDEATLEAVKTAYMAQLALYLPIALDDGEIKYSRVAAALAAVEGANDYSNLQIGLKVGETVTYGTSNIAITSNQLPVIEAADLVLTAGTV